ncbi:MAG TPA: hypothetical protein VIY51_14985 [Xanthobacteraceae bacterium]
MAKRRSSAKAPRRGIKPTVPVAAADDQILSGPQALHDLFQQQMRSMLDRTDLDEEQKQAVLLGASCPCCGAGGFSFTAKLKPRR